MTRLAQGLTNAPAVFQRVADFVLSGLQGISCMIYLDDCVIFSQDVHTHLKHVFDIFSRFHQNNLKLKLSKCRFGMKQMTFLGFVVSANGISADPEKTRAMENYPVPKDVKQIQQALGFFNYYRRFIPGFSKIAAPLVELNKVGAKFEWTERQQQAFNFLRKSLSTPPILAHPRFDRPFLLLIAWYNFK